MTDRLTNPSLQHNQCVEAPDWDASRNGQHSRPLPDRAIHWADAFAAGEPLQCESTNGLSEDMIARAQEQFHCSRSQAINVLNRTFDECSE